MKRYHQIITIVAIIAVASSGCGFAFHAEPHLMADGTPDVKKCRQSNLASGFDVVGAIGGVALIAAGLGSDPREDQAVAVGAVAATVLTTTAAYGFVRSSRCRTARRAAGLSTRGGHHWIYPLVVTTAVVVTLKLMGRGSGSGGSYVLTGPQCRPGDAVTAICVDGSVSCSKVRMGTCSHHGGVAI